MYKSLCVVGIDASLMATCRLAASPVRPFKLAVPWVAGGDTDSIFGPPVRAAPAEARRPDRRHRYLRRIGHDNHGARRSR